MAFRIVFVFLSIAAIVLAEDYCQLCENHVGCNNDGEPAPNCHKILQLTDDHKQQLLDLHNQLRNQQANGETDGYETAARMGTMQWDEELAKTAHFNVASCTYGHDKCRDISGMDNVGQNIALEYIAGDYQDPKVVIDAQVKAWFSEFKDCDMSLINQYNNNGKEIGHFTQIVRDSADRIGCAMSQFKYKGKYFANYLVCNYAMTNNFFWNIYVAGPPASNCTTGPNPNYQALCSESEEYDHSTPTIQLDENGNLPPGFTLPPGVQLEYD